jgi:hypothetical protein
LETPWLEVEHHIIDTLSVIFHSSSRDIVSELGGF